MKRTEQGPRAVTGSAVEAALDGARRELARIALRMRVFEAAAAAAGVAIVIAAAATRAWAPAALGGLGLFVAALRAARWRARSRELEREVVTLELLREAASHERAPLIVASPTPAVNEAAPAIVIVREAAAARRLLARGGDVPQEPSSAPAWTWGAAALGGIALAAAFVVVVSRAADEAARTARRWTFVDPGDVLALGFQTPIERSGAWRIEDHEHATGARALVNHAGEPGEEPAVALVDSFESRDLRATTRCKAQHGRTAAACGMVFRYTPSRGHYVAHVDATTRRLVLSVVEGGRERVIEDVRAEIDPGIWQELAVRARAERITVFWNGNVAIDVADRTLLDGGAAGLWAPSDAVALFDELHIEPLSGRRDLAGLLRSSSGGPGIFR